MDYDDDDGCCYNNTKKTLSDSSCWETRTTWAISDFTNVAASWHKLLHKTVVLQEQQFYIWYILDVHQILLFMCPSSKSSPLVSYTDFAISYNFRVDDVVKKLLSLELASHVWYTDFNILFFFNGYCLCLSGSTFEFL